MRILSNNECEMVSGGQVTPKKAEEFKEKETGVKHECKWVKDHNGDPIMKCDPVRPSAHVFFG